MRINKLSLENFKCFKKADFELGKLTLLTGANSSGKSSVLYSILGTLQSGEFPLSFSPNGKYVNMGNFKELYHKHLKDNTVKIGINFDDSEL
ncbi:MAG: AAA family ATPase [bacterium]|nr:AAA family ATPase [bacterium]